MPFFDSLVHPTRDGRWLGTARYDATLGRLLADMDRGGIDRACLVGIPGVLENEDVAAFARSHPDRFVPVAGLNPAGQAGVRQAEDAVRDLAAAGFPAIKLHPRFNGYDPLDPRCLAAIEAAGRNDVVVFLCTLFRQRGRTTRHPADIVDHIANACPHTRIVLLHGCASGMLDIFELVRMHSHLVLDLALTILRYAGSSLDSDMRFLCRTLDERLTFGSDFPEYLPSEAKEKIVALADGLSQEKRDNIFFKNLSRLFADWRGI